MTQLLLSRLTLSSRVRLMSQQPSHASSAAQEWLHPISAVQGMSSAMHGCRGSLNTAFQFICLSGLVGGSVPGLLRTVESLLQRQDESFSMIISSGTCHSGVWVPPKPSQLCPPLALPRYEEMFLFFHRWRATEYRERSPNICGASFELTQTLTF